MAIGAAVAPKATAESVSIPSGYAEATFETEYLGNPQMFCGFDPAFGPDCLSIATVSVDEDGGLRLLSIERK
jgi:hypothetical protein